MKKKKTVEQNKVARTDEENILLEGLKRKSKWEEKENVSRQYRVKRKK